MLKNMVNKLKITQIVCKLPTKITAISLMLMFFAMVITGCAGQISDDCTGDWSYNKLPSNYEIWKVDDSYNALVRVDMDNPNEAKEVVTDTVKEFVLVDETIFLKCKNDKDEMIYYIVNTLNNDVSSGMTKEELEEKAKDVDIDKMKWQKVDPKYLDVEY